jgi:tetratricopeptide (TPR) repeat protein
MRVLFCNIGWMKYYEGVTDDDQILFGGSYVEEFKEGAEQYNFLDINGYYYGFVETKSNRGNRNKLHIEKIEGIDSSASEANNVLVIWMAKDPTSKHTKMIGWYKDATVYRVYQEKNIAFYNIKAKAENCLLIPVSKRNRIIYRAKEIGLGKGPGMAEIWYAQEPEAVEIAKEHIKYVLNYSGPIQNKYLKKEEIEASASENISEEEHYEKANAYLENEDYRNAIKHYNSIIQINPRDVNALYDKGFSLYRLSSYDEAISLFKKVTDLQHDADDAYFLMGEIYYNFDSINDSLDCYNKAIEISPDNEEYSIGLINCYLYKGDFKSALEASNNIINKNKDSIGGYIAKATVLERTGEYPKSIEAYDKCIRISMDSDEIAFFFYKKAQLYFNLRKQKEALESITKALEVHPEDGYYKALKEQIIEVKS